MSIEQSFVMVKPNGVQRGLVGEVISRLERRGLKIVAIKFTQATKEQAAMHYNDIQHKSIFCNVVNFICSGPIVAMVWEGPNAISIIRATIGSTDPVKAIPGTIRGDFAVDVSRNVVHGSDGNESARREISLWFTPSELQNYNRSNDHWISAPEGHAVV